MAKIDNSERIDHGRRRLGVTVTVVEKPSCQTAR